MADIEKAEREKMREKVNNIIGHGINCFINRQARRCHASAALTVSRTSRSL